MPLMQEWRLKNLLIPNTKMDPIEAIQLISMAFLMLM